MTDLHDKITTRLAELRTTAEAAASEDVRLSLDWPRTPAKDALIRHFDSFGPAAALRWITWAEDVARRHHLIHGTEHGIDYSGCATCMTPAWPCPDLNSLAQALGLEDTS